jgi:hypothetical protein
MHIVPEIWPHAFHFLEFEQNVRNAAWQYIQDNQQEEKRRKVFTYEIFIKAIIYDKKIIKTGSGY